MSRVVMTTRLVVLFVGVIVPASSTFGQASFQGLGDLPGGEFKSGAFAVSADGRVVTGFATTQYGTEAFRWEDGAMVGLGVLAGTEKSEGKALSADGSVIVGESYPADGGRQEGFRWEGGRMISLGLLPGGVSSWAEGVSADGSVVVGCATNAQGWSEAFRWHDGQMIGLGFLPNDGDGPHSVANAVSADGSVIVGASESLEGSGTQAFRWENGVIAGLGYLWHTGPNAHSCAYAVTPDGSVIVGQSRADGAEQAPHEAFRWQDGVMASLGGLPSGYSHCFPYAVSAEGAIVVGHCGDGTLFIWDPTNGMQDLHFVLADWYGLDLTGWALIGATGISDDGRTVVGMGFNPDGDREGWIARLEGPVVPPTVLWSDPPDGAIDARQDFSTSGLTPKGIDRLRVQFSTAVADAITGAAVDIPSFGIQSTSGPAPSILAVNPLDDLSRKYDVVLQDPIPPGAWTTITAYVKRADGLPHEESYPDITIGFLPGDANGDGMSAPSDILRLIDNLNGVYHPPMEMWQCDIDRSGVCGPPDILRLIDLLNGVNTSRPWLNVSLPPRPE